MIKQMLEYVDIDKQHTTQTLYFNLTQFEVEGEMELEVIQARFQKFQDEVIGKDPNAPIRDMTGPEKREILGMVKTLIRHSYGVRDGKKIRKTRIDKDTGRVENPEIWADFVDTGAFSAFLYWLFDKPERANAFMTGIWPQGVDRPEDEPRPDLKVVPTELEIVQGEVIEKAKDETPSIEAQIHDMNVAAFAVRDNLWDYSESELLEASDNEFEAILRKFTQGRNVPLPLLQIGSRRKTGGTTE